MGVMVAGGLLRTSAVNTAPRTSITGSVSGWKTAASMGIPETLTKSAITTCKKFALACRKSDAAVSTLWKQKTSCEDDESLENVDTVEFDILPALKREVLRLFIP
jgi:hypothetical protein